MGLLTSKGAERPYAERRPGFDRRFAKSVTVTFHDGVEVDLHRTLCDGVHAVLGSPAPAPRSRRDLLGYLSRTEGSVDEVAAEAERWGGSGAPADHLGSGAVDLGLQGRTAAVAAATAGLGLASARALAEEGVRVAVCGRDRDRLDAALTDLPEGTVGVVADVGTPDGATAFVERAIEALGRVDVLVPNAGGPPAGTFATTPLEAYAPALELNLLSTVAMCHAAVPAMVDRGWGRVVAITSATVRQPRADLILSNTARAGATAFLKTLATEVAPHGVTVNSVQPGIHRTARFDALYGDDESAVERASRHVPVGEVGRAEDFGRVVAFLCSDAARFVTGTALPVDGGATQALQ